MEKDNATVESEDTANVEAVDADPVATEPAYESGPHLQEPDVRAAKRQQMLDYGWTEDTEGLTDDMYDILREEG